MARLVVCNPQDRLKDGIKPHDRGMEEEARDIPRKALREEEAPVAGLGTRMSALFQQSGLIEEIPELRGHPANPALFE